MPSYFPENNEPKPMDSSDRSLQKINSLLATGGAEVSIANGEGGGRYVGNTNTFTGSWSAIQVLADAKFHTLTGNVSDLANTTDASAPVVPAGNIVYGRFTALKLHSGRLIAYSA